MHQIERKAFERTELAALQAPLPVQAEPVEAPTLSTQADLDAAKPFIMVAYEGRGNAVS